MALPLLKDATTEATETINGDRGNRCGLPKASTEGAVNGTSARSELVHGGITNGILAAAYKLHSRLGPGLLESAYKACLAQELAAAGVTFETEKTLPVHYDGIRVDLGYRVDMVVDDAVIVEVKAVEKVLPVHEAQLLSYLRLSGKRVGLLINFNVVSLRHGIRRRSLGYGP